MFFLFFLLRFSVQMSSIQDHKTVKMWKWVECGTRDLAISTQMLHLILCSLQKKASHLVKCSELKKKKKSAINHCSLFHSWNDLQEKKSEICFFFVFLRQYYIQSGSGEIWMYVAQLVIKDVSFFFFFFNIFFKYMSEMYAWPRRCSQLCLGNIIKMWLEVISH